MSETSRERLQTAGWIACALVLIAILVAALVWHLLAPRPIRQEGVVTVVRRIYVQAPPPLPPRQTVPQRVDSADAAPAPKPMPPRPRAYARAAARPLTADPSSTLNLYYIPPGADDGLVIGGGGGGGEGRDGSGCGGADYYLTTITSQLRNVFMRNEKADDPSFHVRARVWFDGAGGLRRAQLIDSTGDSGRDRTVVHLLGEVEIGGAVPQCLQPFTVWVSDPWTGSPGEARGHVATWQRPR